MNRVIMAALAAFFASPALADEASELRAEKQLGEHWMLRSYQTTVTHEFKFCIASTHYDTNTRLARAKRVDFGLSMMPDGTTNFIIIGDTWHLTEERTHLLNMEFPDGQRFKAEVAPTLNGLIALGMTTEWLKEFMNATGVKVGVDDKYIGNYWLSDSFNAAVGVAKCVTANAQPGPGSTETFGAANAPQSPSGETETFGGSEPTPEQAKDTF